MSDRRFTRFTTDKLEHLLRIPGKITAIVMNHRANIVEVYFEGDGTRQTAEGQEAWCMSIPLPKPEDEDQ